MTEMIILYRSLTAIGTSKWVRLATELKCYLTVVAVIKAK